MKMIKREKFCKNQQKEIDEELLKLKLEIPEFPQPE